MNGKEDYATLKESLVNVVKDVDNLIEKGYILVDGRQIKLEFYLRGEYKVKHHTKVNRRLVGIVLEFTKFKFSF